MKLKINQKISLGIISVLALFSGIIAIGGYEVFSKIIFNVYTDNAISIANASRSICSNYDLNGYVESCIKNDNQVTPEFKVFHESLDNLCNDMGATFIYIITPDQSDYKHITFHYSSASRNSGKNPFKVGYVRNTTNEEYEAAYRRLIEGKSEYENILRDKGVLSTGHHITTLVPLHEEGQSSVTKLIAVEKPMTYLYSARRNFLLLILIVTIISNLKIYFVFRKVLEKIIVARILRIASETERFAKENTITEDGLSDLVESVDEIGCLACSINEMEHEIIDYIRNITAITAEKEKSQTMLKVATSIQLGALPKPIALDSIDLYATMKPALEVGGDFYDFFKIDDKHLVLVVADVSGKGVPAALFMMVSKIILKKNLKAGLSPAEALFQTNLELCDENPAGMFVTCLCGILDLDTNLFSFANAGHEKPVVCRKNGAFEFINVKSNLVLGAMPGIKYQDQEIQLNPGDIMFNYTDGIPEAMSPSNEEFGNERLSGTLNASKDKKLEEICNDLFGAIASFNDTAPQFDDITMVALKIK